MMQPVDVIALRHAHERFIAEMSKMSFGPPPVGEWDAGYVLAHVAAANFSIASVALAVAAGQHPRYDNRTTLDPWHLRVLIGRCDGLTDLLAMVATSGELLCSVAENLPYQDLDYPLPTLIVSKQEAVLNETIPLRTLIEGIGDAHLPLHTQQLRALVSASVQAGPPVQSASATVCPVRPEPGSTPNQRPHSGAR